MTTDSTTTADDATLFLGEAWSDPIEAGIRDRIRGFIEKAARWDGDAYLLADGRRVADADLWPVEGNAGPIERLALFKLDRLGYAGALHDPVAATLFCAPQQADCTVINGRVVVCEGRLTTVDVPTLIEKHNRIARAMLEA